MSRFAYWCVRASVFLINLILNCLEWAAIAVFGLGVLCTFILVMLIAVGTYLNDPTLATDIVALKALVPPAALMGLIGGVATSIFTVILRFNVQAARRDSVLSRNFVFARCNRRRRR